MGNLSFKSNDFVHLHLHTDYSLLQSTIQLKPLAKKLNELDLKACAITDYGNMYGAVSFYNAMRSAGVRPIFGYEANLIFSDHFENNPVVQSGERPYYSIVLIAETLEGYENLVYLSSKAFTEGLYHKPRINRQLLAEHSRGLICLTSGFDGPVWHFLKNDNIQKASDNLGSLIDIFGKDNVFLEIQDHDVELERSAVKQTVQIGKQLGLQLVATNDVHYLTPDDARAREALICISEGRSLSDRYVLPTDKYYLKSAEEMWDIFGSELPDSLKNTLAIAERCDVKLADGDNLTLPTYPIPPDSGCSTTDDYFVEVLHDGFAEKEATVWTPMREAGKLKYSPEQYKERLQIEIDTINNMGFAGYFLIVWDFIKYAKDKGIPVGPGRGSAAGSLAAYCMDITGIDPLEYDLLFERFLNPERISMPDIDIDFCIRGRGEVIQHVTDVYGRDSVCQIITFGTMASKASIKDVGRALSMPYGDVEKIAKLIPPPVRGRNVSISQALEQVPELKSAFNNDPKVKDLVDLALRIEGCNRHTSVHAAGVVISPKPLHELVPVAISSKNELTSQYSMNDLEKVGMLKMDFLALTTLTIISDCLANLKEKTGVEIDWSMVDLNDEATMHLFGEGKTEAIFQFESSGMQDICRRLKPKELEDLSALNALYRPGPIDGGMIEDFIVRHRGEKKIKYLVPEMQEILENTYGVLVYQEQIMQLAQKLAGYSLGEADMMRRAMGKKKREEMALHAEKFVSGSVANGIAKDKAEEIFSLMSQFADYGFNRSHSVAYAYLAFQTAYLKAHYPAFFYSAVLSHESDDSAKVYKYSSELRGMGLELLPPDINESDDSFTPSNNAVRFGLTAIKGIGTSSIHSLMEARKSGPFTSLFDFASRLDQGAFGRRGMESLIAAGAFDSLEPQEISVNLWRARLYANVEKAISLAQRSWSDRERGQVDLFGGDQTDAAAEDELADAPAWSQAETSRREKEAIGFYLSVHPLDQFDNDIARLGIKKIVDFGTLSGGETISIAGIVSGTQVKYSKKGNRFCIFRLEDQSTGVKCLMWAEAFSKFSEIVKDDEALIVEGRVESVDGNEITLIVSTVTNLSDAIPRNASKLTIDIADKITQNSYFDDLFTILSKETGRCEVFINFKTDDIELEIQSLPLRIQGSAKLHRQLVEHGCSVNWSL